MKLRVHLGLLSFSRAGETGRLHKAFFFSLQVQEHDMFANKVMAGKFI